MCNIYERVPRHLLDRTSLTPHAARLLLVLVSPFISRYPSASPLSAQTRRRQPDRPSTIKTLLRRSQPSRTILWPIPVKNPGRQRAVIRHDYPPASWDRGTLMTLQDCGDVIRHFWASPHGNSRVRRSQRSAGDLDCFW